MKIDFNLSQIILIIIACYFIGDRIIKWIKKERAQSIFKLAATFVVWIGIVIFAINPSLARLISRSMGLGDNLNTLIFIGFIVVFIIIFKLLNIIENHERGITEIIRSEALKDILEKYKQ